MEVSDSHGAHSMVEWMKQHTGLVVTSGISIVLLVVGIIVIPIVVARLPKDFFTREDHEPSPWLNILGWVLVVAGIAMMVLPGPGAVPLLAGIVIADFPGKRRLLRWILSRGKVFEGLNRIRTKRGKPPLQRPRAG